MIIVYYFVWSSRDFILGCRNSYCRDGWRTWNDGQRALAA